MRKESFDRKNEKYGVDRRFRTHPADRTKRRNVDGRYEEQKPKKRNADRGRVNESRRIKKTSEEEKSKISEKSSGSSILRSCGHSGSTFSERTIFG